MDLLRRNPSFRLVWAVHLMSSLVGWSLGLALSVHIFVLTGSPLWTAVLAATPMVAGVLFGHAAGAFADRGSPLRVMQIALGARAVVLVALVSTAEAAVGLAAVAFVQSSLQQVYAPAQQVVVAGHVPPRLLGDAIGLNSFASNATRLVGPALGGAVILAVGFGPTVVGMSVLMVLAAILSLLLRPTPVRDGADAAPGGGRGRRQGVVRGLLSNRRLRALVLFQVSDAVKEGPLSALFPVLMLGVIGANAAEMGLANSAFALTAVIAGPIVGVVTRRLGFRVPIVVGAAVANLLVVALCIVPSTGFAIVAFLLAGLPFTLSWVGAQTWLLLSVPAGMRGRAVGTTGALYSAVVLATTLASGAVAEVVDVRWVIGVGAGIAVLGLIPVLVSTGRSGRSAGDVDPIRGDD